MSEALDIAEHDRELGFLLGRDVQGAIDPLLEQRTIRQSGKPIVKCKIIELLLLFEVIEGEGDVAPEFVQELHLIVVEEGLNIESVAPADDDVLSVYQYLIGSEGASA